MTGLGFPEVNTDFLCFVNIKAQVVDCTPVHQVFQLVPVGQLVVILDDIMLFTAQSDEVAFIQETGMISVM